MFQLLVLVSLSADAFCAVTSQDCDDTGARLSAVSPLIASLFYLQDGKLLKYGYTYVYLCTCATSRLATVARTFEPIC